MSLPLRIKSVPTKRITERDVTVWVSLVPLHDHAPQTER